jgi:hypothetical protein
MMTLDLSRFTPHIIPRQELRYVRELYMTQAQVSYDSRTERNTDVAYILLDSVYDE